MGSCLIFQIGRQLIEKIVMLQLQIGFLLKRHEGQRRLFPGRLTWNFGATGLLPGRLTWNFGATGLFPGHLSGGFGVAGLFPGRLTGGFGAVGFQAGGG